MAWRRALLSAPFHFEVCAKGEDRRFWRSQNLRQEAIQMGDVAQLSTRQWIYDVVGYTRRMSSTIRCPLRKSSRSTPRR
jgi:hypothetical protein